jgi:hypothetical protein
LPSHLLTLQCSQPALLDPIPWSRGYYLSVTNHQNTPCQSIQHIGGIMFPVKKTPQEQK